MMPFIPNPADKSGGSHREIHHFQRMIARKERTAPQHTRFILPLTLPDKIIRLYCVGGIFLFQGRLHLENFMSRPSVIPAFQPTLLQNRGRNFVRVNRRFYIRAETLYLFLRLNNSETITRNVF